MNRLSLSNSHYRAAIGRPAIDTQAIGMTRTHSHTVDIVSQGVRVTYYMHMIDKLESMSRSCLPLRCEAGKDTGIYTMTYAVGLNSLKSEIDRLQSDRRFISEIDVKAIFALYLFTYKSFEDCLEFDTPSLDRIFVFDGQLRFMNPYCFIDHAKTVSSVITDNYRNCCPK